MKWLCWPAAVQSADVPTCSRACELAAKPPSPTQNADDVGSPLVQAAVGSFHIADTRLKPRGAGVPLVTAYPAQFAVTCGSAAAAFTKSSAVKVTAARTARLRIARRSPLRESREIGHLHEAPGRPITRTDEARIVRSVNR